MNRSVLTVLTVFILVGVCLPVRAEDISLLISQGRLDEARKALERLGRDSAGTGNALYFRAMLESDAAQSAALLEKALTRKPEARFREDIVFRLAQYYVVTKDLSKAATLIDAELSNSPGAYGDDLGRLRILASEQSRSLSDARRRLDQLQNTMTTADGPRWWLIDQARLSSAEGKPKATQNALQALARQKGGPGLPQALYLLCSNAVEKGRADEAVRWFNLLKESYPNAVGLDALVDKLSGMPTTGSRPDTRAEAATGTYYSVKAGVFSSSDNASAQAGKFRGLKVKVEVVPKNVGGKKYSIVFVGRYKSFDEADKARQQFESQTGEQYQVVAR
ncbi:MAG: tetratricopeptide repeat protein [candidate division Zixibacteria bacterium]|nr:tetratricopeptide repeat protein [candidate division Zixibacteria bacterium]